MAKEIQNSGSEEDKNKLKNIYEETVSKLNGKSNFLNIINEIWFIRPKLNFYKIKMKVRRP